MEDPRDNRGKKHDFVEILVLIVIGFLIGKTDFVNMAHCLEKERDSLKEFLVLKNGIPSHDTFSRIMRIIEPQSLMYHVCDWFSCLADRKGTHIAIDGKGILAAARKNQGGKTPYIVNALETATKTVLMQLKVGDKTNEITTIPELLKYMELEDVTVTTDAIGTQKEIIRVILEKGGHYVLPVKENQALLLEEVKLYIEDAIERRDGELDVFEDTCQCHGRIERRKYFAIRNHSCITEKGYQSAVTIGKVWRNRKINTYRSDGEPEKTTESVEQVYYISDRELKAEEFARYVREHWKVEDSLHWVLDNTFREDRSTAKKGNATENLALMRKVAYNIIRLHERVMPGHSIEYLIDELKYDLPQIMKYIGSSEKISLS